uniref:hypothetical protein n=1 Tax=Waltera acetigignens TaxID=2981769 RepID=UPI003F7D7535
MEMLKKLKKKIVPLVLAVVIFATSVVSGPASLTAQAASVAVSPEMSVEFVMMLYNIFETISIASGIKDGLDDYDSGMSLFEAFISFLDSIKFDPIKEFSVYGPDGNLLTDEYMDALLASAVGAGKLKVRPNEGEFAKYRVLTGGLTPTPSPDPSASPTPTAIPGPGHGTDLNPNIPKRGIGAFAMGTDMQFQKAAADFLNRVQNNAVPEVDPAKYYGTAGLFDNIVLNPDGTFTPLGYIKSFYGNGEGYYLYTSAGSFYGADKYPDLSHIDKPAVAYIENSSMKFVSGSFPYVYQRFEGDVCKYTSDHVSVGNGISFDSYNVNFPVFDSVEHANLYVSNGSLVGLLNGVPYDYHSMTAAAPDTLENLSGTKLDPAKVPAMNNAMKEAANGVEATGTDKEANNAEMIAAVKAAVAEALAEAQPDPAPEPTAAPDPEPSTAPDPGTDTNYSGILGLILSAINAIASGIWDFFSHPIQNITNGITGILEMFPQVNALIQALPAAVYGFFQDPLGTISTGISNLYNGVLRIIEIFPEQVQLVLGNIASLPSAMLQVFADPLGVIQSLLGTLPSWANLQAYLDKILQALLDPVSVLQPSDPGGTDPGGDGSGDGSKFNLSSLFNGLIYLILILILLLKIFIHCLQFIINIFKIEPTQGFLPDDMVTGLNFLKQLQIEGIGLSVYDFMMGLVYILMFFGVVKLLRGYVYKIHISSGGK